MNFSSEGNGCTLTTRFADCGPADGKERGEHATTDR
jgi:hypothetical protein